MCKFANGEWPASTSQIVYNRHKRSSISCDLPNVEQTSEFKISVTLIERKIVNPVPLKPESMAILSGAKAHFRSRISSHLPETLIQEQIGSVLRPGTRVVQNCHLSLDSNVPGLIRENSLQVGKLVRQAVAQVQAGTSNLPKPFVLMLPSVCCSCFYFHGYEVPDGVECIPIFSGRTPSCY